MSQTQQHAQQDRSLANQPTPSTAFDTDDTIENPFGREYRVCSTYYSKQDSPMVHLRRRRGRHDMYVTVTRLHRMIDEDWNHHSN